MINSLLDITLAGCVPSPLLSLLLLFIFIFFFLIVDLRGSTIVFFVATGSQINHNDVALPFASWRDEGEREMDEQERGGERER